jgi:hypothetical protein
MRGDRRFHIRLKLWWGTIWALAIGLALLPAFARAPVFHFLPLGQVSDLIAEMINAGAPDVPADDIKGVASWDRWIQQRDREIRNRINRGSEDAISNLILYGSSYTNLPPFANFAQASNGLGQLTDAARHRIHALSLALLRPGSNERVIFARDFLARTHVSSTSLESYLTDNLLRMISEESAYVRDQEAAVKTGDIDTVLLGRATMFKQRGLSFDTSLEPDYGLEVTLRQLTRKELMIPGSIRRIAVIGPGLDFADKRSGLDFYPVQTVQPFAILETVARLRLGEADKVRVTALDLNPAVLEHIQNLSRRAGQGRPYVVQLPMDSRNHWDPEMVSYWQHFGEFLGSPATPLPPPTNVQGIQVRAVKIQPKLASPIEAWDLDVVAQQYDPPPQGGFDLVVATNVFLYYNFFEQALALQNIVHMMNPGGVLIVNQVLSNQHPDSLQFLDQCYVSFSSRDNYGDNLVAYQRQ